jgi:hypothetical protein
MNKKIKVSEATVAKLRKGTMAGNLAMAKNASPEMKEALTRFYGAKRVNAAIGKSTASAPTAKSSGPGARMPKRPAGGPGAKSTRSTTKTSAKSTAKSGSVFAPSGSRSTPAERRYEKVYNAVTSQGSKPFIDVPAGLSSAQKKMKDKAKANAELVARQRKMAQDKKKKLK